MRAVFAPTLTLRERYERACEALAHWIARRLPRDVRYWAVIVAAVRTTDSYPGDVTAKDMLEAIR